MNVFFERLLARAATVDELLSDDFGALPGQKGDADLAARRLAAWCRSCTSGDWSLFGRRLERDRLSVVEVLARFATVRRLPSALMPAWIDDAVWIEAALQSPRNDGRPIALIGQAGSCAFEPLLAPLIEAADTRLWEDIDGLAASNLNESARAGLRYSLLNELSVLCAPALYERFDKVRTAATVPTDVTQGQPHGRTSQFEQFFAKMKTNGFRQLFADKPILLRLIASITRQWIETSRELVLRLDADLTTIRQGLLRSGSCSRVAKIECGLSDRHNGGRSVQIISFEDGSQIVYKPKDLRVDVAWYSLIGRLNRADPPVELKAVRSISREGYGWSEFIAHKGCAEREDCKKFFRRAGAWLALFHCFAASDMHEENIIAAGDHPVPIDLEMILQATSKERESRDPEEQAFAAAMETIADSVSTVGLLPMYGRSPDNRVIAMGGLISNHSAKKKLVWDNINSDGMRPLKLVVADNIAPNLPHINGDYAEFGNFIDDFVSGFADYAYFLLRQSRDSGQRKLFDGFGGLPVRKVIRPTRFYYMLLRRLLDHRAMDDGVAWAAQSDFVARLADWDKDCDLVWPLHHAERAALVQLNVPYFISTSDGHEIRATDGTAIYTDATPGLERARSRAENLSEQDIAWQIEVIRQNTDAVSASVKRSVAGASRKRVLRCETSNKTPREIFVLEVDKIAGELSGRAIRRGAGAAWIGVDWLDDSDVSQLVALGSDLYNGSTGIALFFAAHAAVAKRTLSRQLALAAIAGLRKSLKSRNSGRFARSLGIGGATGLGSIVYALTLMATCLQDDELLTDAHVAVELLTDDLIAADKHLDVLGGSAGAILALLRLYNVSRSDDALRCATKCGEHLLAQARLGLQDRRSWRGQCSGTQALNGMSHGAAGFAYALNALFAATRRAEFLTAASECVAFENSSYDTERHNWPDLRGAADAAWPCQWCHGAVGIGLARLAMAKHGGVDTNLLREDIRRAHVGVERAWPNAVDTLCCGTMGTIEFLYEVGRALDRRDLRDAASERLMTVVESAAENGDYQWNLGRRQFNVGLFRGLAGIGYTLLRRIDDSLPNVLVLE